MRRSLDILPFLAVAGVAHVLFFWSTSDDGISAGGVGGDHSVALMAIASSAEAMVAEWEAAPQAVVEMPDIDMPKVEDASLAAAALTHSFSTDAQIKITAVEEISGAETSPDGVPSVVPTPLSRALPQLAMQAPSLATAARQQPETRPKPITDRQLPRPVAPQAIADQSITPDTPTIDTTPPPPPEKKPEPKPKQKPKEKAKQVADKASKASAGRAEQKAAGQGGQKVSGTNGAKTQNSISSGKKNKLMRVWQSKLQRRIERRKRDTRGRHPPGKVIVLIKIDRNGNLLSKGIAKSSGVTAHDKAALATINRAGRFPGAPKELPGNTFRFHVPLKYK